MTDINATLAALRDTGLYRERRVIDSATGPHVVLEHRQALLMCSNDYLGLAGHPDVRAAAADGAMLWGAGAGASPLISGHLALHQRLEEELAGFKGYEACVLFGSGFLANTGIIAALAGSGDVIVSDALNHASIIDGCRQSRADTIVYDHCDLDSLESGLTRANGRPTLIVTDAVFSMDGDLAPLDGVVTLAQTYGARVLVDEAHATGVVGPGGRGLVAELGLESQVDVVVGTLGKALGSYGAFACCTRATADYLINRARTLIYSTALPPPAVAAALAALHILQQRPELVEQLGSNARLLRAELADHGFDVATSDVPIVPLVAGSPESALAISEALLHHGIFAQAIRPPTVPDGTSRLRLVTIVTHSEHELRHAATTLAEIAPSVIRASRSSADRKL